MDEHLPREQSALDDDILNYIRMRAWSECERLEEACDYDLQAGMSEDDAHKKYGSIVVENVLDKRIGR